MSRTTTGRKDSRLADSPIQSEREPQLPTAERNGNPTDRFDPDRLANSNYSIGRTDDGSCNDHNRQAIEWEKGSDDLAQRGSTIGKPTPGPWDTFQLIGPDRDGKYRRIEPGLTPLDARVPETMAELRGFGNAICPQLAAVFISACADLLAEQSDRAT